MGRDTGAIFVGGMNRTGTSMLRQMLGSHSSVAMPPTEFEFFKHVHVLPRARLREAEVGTLVDRIVTWPKIAQWQINRDRVLALALEQRSHRGIFTAFLRAYAEGMSRPRFGDKTTSYERYVPILDRWFDDYTFVHMVRHPVAAFASSRWYGGRERHVDPLVFARTWNTSVLTGMRRARARTTYVLLRYEDVVQDPEAVIEAVCVAAGIPFQPRMLAMPDVVERENSSFDVSGADYVGAVRRQDGIVRAGRVPHDELRVILGECRTLAAVLGYDIDDELTTRPLTARRVPLSFQTAYAVNRTARRLRTSLGGMVRLWRKSDRT